MAKSELVFGELGKTVRDEVTITEFNTPSSISGTTNIDCGLENPNALIVATDTNGFDWSLGCWADSNFQVSAFGILCPRSSATRSTWNPTINGSVIGLPSSIISASGHYYLIAIKKNL